MGAVGDKTLMSIAEFWGQYQNLTYVKKIASWSSRWFEEILILVTLISLTLISLTLISLTLISVTLISVTLISVTLILVTLILVMFSSKILTFFSQHSQLGNSFSTYANGTNLTNWNFYRNSNMWIQILEAGTERWVTCADAKFQWPFSISRFVMGAVAWLWTWFDTGESHSQVCS